MQTGDGLDVVIENLRLGVHHAADAPAFGFEIRGQHLHNRVGDGRVQGADGRRELPCPLVGQVVSRDGGHHDMLQPHALRRLRQSLRLLRV